MLFSAVLCPLKTQPKHKYIEGERDKTGEIRGGPWPFSNVKVIERIIRR